ncbi:hypothetical protein L6R52_16080 [Myxococcota bacterium]|nr:hypothetical protein [Myxococcota bacterium]
MNGPGHRQEEDRASNVTGCELPGFAGRFDLVLARSPRVALRVDAWYDRSVLLSRCAGLDDRTFAAMEASVCSFVMLEELIRWGLSCSPQREVVDVVIQDEYSHDVVFRWDDRWFLVFEST